MPVEVTAITFGMHFALTNLCVHEKQRKSMLLATRTRYPFIYHCSLDIQKWPAPWWTLGMRFHSLPIPLHLSPSCFKRTVANSACVWHVCAQSGFCCATQLHRFLSARVQVS
jgi:hypothetical protein